MLSRSLLSTVFAGGALLAQAAPALSPVAAKHWTADNGNGTYSNPLFYGEFEDPDPIRVGNDYYLAGTTMHMMPSVEILHSKDLVNWELASYCTNQLVVVEPRAHGIERELPLGKTITLTSGADGSYLAADTPSNLLVNVAAGATGATAPNVKFQVVDLGLGRVALKAGNGKFVSAAEDGAILKDITGKEPGNAESFQWINLMRGDTALMSLVNHRYLATKPDKLGPVTAPATGPSPARKNGECFKWKAVE